VIQTTSTNYDERKCGIPWSELPATFKDAITLTRAVKIQYLWIDSICIVQNDVSDWEEQSALMSDIYANGYLNITATHSKDGHGGLFGERWTPSLHENPQDRRKRSVKSHAIPFEAGGEIFVRHNLGNAHTDVGTRRSDIAGYDITKYSPLSTRVCAYQERYYLHERSTSIRQRWFGTAERVSVVNVAN
jgi:hypothetical protein